MTTADQTDQQGQDHVNGEDHDCTRRPGFDRHRVNHREEGKSEKEADDEELYDAAQSPNEVQRERGRDQH